MAKSPGISGVLSVAIFILLEFAAVELISRTSSLQNIWINRASHRVMAYTGGIGETVRNYFMLAEQNEELARENFELSRQLEQYRNLFPEEDAKAVKGKAGEMFSYIPAKIIKISRNSQHNYIILNKGFEDGVEPNSGIVTSNGVVGIVDAVDRHYSYGLTLMNTKVSVSARLGRDGVVAPLVWDGVGMDGALFRNVPVQTEVNPGDTISTSGISDIFPGDIPLGVVVGSRTIDGVAKEAEIKLFQDFSAIRYVTVVCNPERKEIENLEKEEDSL